MKAATFRSPTSPAYCVYTEPGFNPPSIGRWHPGVGPADADWVVWVDNQAQSDELAAWFDANPQAFIEVERAKPNSFEANHEH